MLIDTLPPGTRRLSPKETAEHNRRFEEHRGPECTNCRGQGHFVMLWGMLGCNECGGTGRKPKPVESV